MYQISDYARMAADRHRLGAYFRALERTVRADDVVLDLGTGTGLFAMRAAQLGARKVYAIDSNPVVQLARRIAQQNGLGDKIEFIEAESCNASLPEKVDVIVSDMRGVLPLHFTHLPAIIDARKRWLKPQGRLIPTQDTLYAAPVNAAEIYKAYSDCWNGLPYNLQPAEYMRLNTWGRAPIKPEQIVSAAQSWCTLNYATLRSSDVQGDLKWEIARDVVIHGLAVWYVAELADDGGFSTAPGEPETVSGIAFFPFLRPLQIKAEDVVHVAVRAKLIDREYIWGWKTRVTDRAGTMKENFEQCTLAGEFLKVSRATES